MSDFGQPGQKNRSQNTVSAYEEEITGTLAKIVHKPRESHGANRPSLHVNPGSEALGVKKRGVSKKKKSNDRLLQVTQETIRNNFFFFSGHF